MYIHQNNNQDNNSIKLSRWQAAGNDTELSALAIQELTPAKWLQMYNAGELTLQELRVYVVDYFHQELHGKIVDL